MFKKYQKRKEKTVSKTIDTSLLQNPIKCKIKSFDQGNNAFV